MTALATAPESVKESAPCTSFDVPTITLPCPHCDTREASIRVHLGTGVLACEECDNEVTADEVEELIGNLLKWRKVFSWMSTMPTK